MTPHKRIVTVYCLIFCTERELCIRKSHILPQSPFLPYKNINKSSKEKLLNKIQKEILDSHGSKYIINHIYCIDCQPMKLRIENPSAPKRFIQTD